MHQSADQHILERLLESNDELATHNREHLDEDGIFAVNLMSAPGAGKTTLLEATCKAIAGTIPCSVIEGDMVGDLDAQRLRKLGVSAHQITTGKSCHLDAAMIAKLLHDVHLDNGLLFIENVGNLVCPAEFNLGEHRRVVLLSVTEGADKPLKYPVIFYNCDAVVFTKTDLLPYVDFDIEASKQFVRNINKGASIFTISTVTGEGLQDWISWLTNQSQLQLNRASNGKA
jgi:hydrogenase nickel incorporation protein HypB